MADDTKKLQPNDPTPDPESDPVDVVSGDASGPNKGTTFVDVVDAAKAAAEKLDVSDGVDAVEIVDAALEGAAKILPLPHHTVTELRKLLVPIITAIITAIAAGGFAEWRAGAAKDEAVQEVEQRALDLEKIRTEVRKELLKSASWDDVGATLMVDEEGAAKKALVSYTAMFGKGDSPEGLTISPTDLKRLDDLVRNEAQQIQLKLPPKPALAVQPR